MPTSDALPPVLDLLRDLDGVTPALLAVLQSADVTSAEDLALALDTQVVRRHSDASVARRIARTLRSWPQRPAQRALGEAREAAVRVLTRLQAHESALRLAVAGAVRRMEPVVETIDLVATAHDPAALREAFVALPMVDRTLVGEAGWTSVALDEGTIVRLRVYDEDPHAWFVRWIEATGPVEHVDALRARATDQGLLWSDAGLTRDGTAVDAAWEDDIYTALGLPAPAPEQRTATLATEATPLVTAGDLLGVANLHTDAGEGVASLFAMADRASREGYAWAWITDLGLDDAARAAQHVAARNWNLKRDAAEPDEGMPRPAQLIGLSTTARIARITATQDLGAAVLAAVNTPEVRVLGHLDARVASGWGSLEDWLPVLEACVASNTAIEISGQRRRAPFPGGFHQQARQVGVRILLGADAYDPEGLDAVLGALGTARRGGWAPGEVLNTLPAVAFNEWLGD